MNPLRTAALGACAALGVPATAADLPPDYSATDATVRASLASCLAASPDRSSDLICSDAGWAECLRIGPGGDTTYGMASCSIVLFRAWDDELNRLWPTLRREHAGAAGEALLAAQRAWIAFRDAECGFEAERFAGGSMGAYSGGWCMVGMTVERVADFRDWSGRQR